MAKRPRSQEAEVEVICPQCGYRLARSPARLRRDPPVVCPNCGYRVTDAPPQHEGE